MFALKDGQYGQHPDLIGVEVEVRPWLVFGVGLMRLLLGHLCGSLLTKDACETVYAS